MTEASEIDVRSTFKPEYVEQARKLAQLGATDAEIADFFDVQARSLYRWRNRFPELAEALKAGKDAPDERVVRGLYQKAVGYTIVEQQAIKVVKSYTAEGKKIESVEIVDVEKHVAPDTTACIFWLKNRRKDDWRDKQEHEHTGNMTVNIVGADADL